MPAHKPTDYERAAYLLGLRVHRLRRQRGYTQETLAERTGLSRNQIQNIERNRNNRRDPRTGRPGIGNPQLETVFLLAAELEVDPAYLISSDPEVMPPPPPATRRRKTDADSKPR
ncbi:MAG TPA: helix-turn-helix transcriptional regulator [Marmoricola sp.]|nr:helix-turn-helix transcriptional regulator [Marmoricola sp.]